MRDSQQWFTTRAELDPGSPNEVTMRSLDNYYCYEPAKYLPEVTPTPLSMIVGGLPTEERASGPPTRSSRDWTSGRSTATPPLRTRPSGLR
jgi:hypothetical protein